MFKVRSIVLTTALFGTQTRNTASAAPGCFPAYISSGTYASGDKVSATTTTESSESHDHDRIVGNRLVRSRDRCGVSGIHVQDGGDDDDRDL